MWRLIDISGDNNYFHVKNRNIMVEREGKASESIPFDDINSIIVHGHNNRFSEEFFHLCIEHSIPVVFCDSQHMPSGMLLSEYSHTDYASRLLVQIKASLPRCKQAWQKIIKAKVHNQATLLSFIGEKIAALDLYAKEKHVLSADSTNIEAQAARVYFKVLFGDSFIRHEGDIKNLQLNYGYTILRSLVARAVVGSGLNPGLSIFHSPRINPFALCDDLVEPLRPFADSIVKNMKADDVETLTPESKRQLISLLTFTVEINGRKMELYNAVYSYVYSYYQFIKGEMQDIVYPLFSMEDI